MRAVLVLNSFICLIASSFSHSLIQAHSSLIHLSLLIQTHSVCLFINFFLDQLSDSFCALSVGHSVLACRYVTASTGISARHFRFASVVAATSGEA